MFLYVCPNCGRWQDVSFVKALTDVLNNVSKALGQPAPEHPGYPCPAGHGLMIQVQPEDRVSVRSLVVEAQKDERA